MLKSLALFTYLASLVSQPTPSLENEQVYSPFSVDYAAVTEAPVESFTALGGAVSLTASVTLVEGRSVAYRAPEYALPMDWDLVDQERWGRPHHDYPALDVQVPTGTPVFAIREGNIGRVAGSDGACGGTINLSTDFGQIMYCHLSKLVVRSGDWVETGQLIGYSGGRPGSYGAGSSSVAHLHVGLVRNGQTVCIQPLLVSLAKGKNPDFSITTRCSN